MLIQRISLFAACGLVLSACGSSNIQTYEPVPIKDQQPATAQPLRYITENQDDAARRQAEQLARQQQQQAEQLARQQQQQTEQEARQRQQQAEQQARQQRLAWEQQKAALEQQQQAERQRYQIAWEQEQQRLKQQHIAEQQQAEVRERYRQAWEQKQREQEQQRQALARQQAEEQQRQQLAEQQQAEAQRQQQMARQQQQRQQQQQQLAEKRRQEYQQQLARRQQQNQPPQLAPAVQLQYAGGRMYTGPGRFTRLPDSVASSLRLRGVSERGMSAYVRPASGNAPALLTASADTPRNPASTMKLVTTYAALGTLGPNFRWPTEIYTTGPIQGGVLQGDVVIKGYGDPDFKEANLRRMLQSLRARGVQRIAGNLVADTSFFSVPYQNPGAFDGNAKAAYNAQPEALLYQGRGSKYQFKGLGRKVARTAGLPSSTKARNDLDSNLFAAFWKIWGGELRGQIQGDFRTGATPSHAQKVFTNFSPPLREVIKEINKESVNVMARQVLLTLAAYRMGAPGTPAKGTAAVSQFLESRGLNFPELRVENGSGLSRVARISARHLGEMLVDAYNSPFRNDYMNSLAVLGVDGTLENRMKRSPVNGKGRFKTGTLRNVRGLAGYLQAANGETYVVSILHNDPKARSAARSAHDDLVEWVYWGPRNNFASAD